MREDGFHKAEECVGHMPPRRYSMRTKATATFGPRSSIPFAVPGTRVNVGGICGQAAIWEVLKIQIPSLFSGGR